MKAETDCDAPRERADFMLKVYRSEGFYVKVFCDLCDAQDEGLRESLRLRGWHINRSECFCPKHQGE